MNNLRKGVTVIAGLTLILSVTIWWKGRSELSAARQELRAVTEANDFLKKTLGDLTVAMAAKDREIDRVRRSPCGAQREHLPESRSERRPQALTRPSRSESFDSNLLIEATRGETGR